MAARPLAWLSAAAAAAGAGIADPAWDYVPNVEVKCVDASDQSTPPNSNNQRLAIYALPDGTPPAGGWPVYLHLVTDKDIVNGTKCGPSGHGHGGDKPFTAFSTPKETMASCFDRPPTPAPPTLPPPGPDDCVCPDEYPYCWNEGSGNDKYCYRSSRSNSKSDTVCAGTCTRDATGYAPPAPMDSGCYYEQMSGAMWDQRLKQYLVKNGIAVMQINPITDDSWDAMQALWDGWKSGSKTKGGVDKPFFQVLFKQMIAGTFGKLDASKIVVRGWSSGAQMVSWLFQIFATEGATTFPGVKLAGGVMLSGGSYACYADTKSGGYDPDPPRQPVGSCKNCIEQPSSSQGGGCSQTGNDSSGKCGSCNPDVASYCGYCCPRDFAEAYYDENPDQWSSHPPVFLAQTSGVDGHADLCACKNYHELMLSKGVKSTFVPVPPEDMSCFCVGNPNNPDAADSPWSQHCSDADWGEHCTVFPNSANCCITHTLGFASMVKPAVQFVIDSTK